MTNAENKQQRRRRIRHGSQSKLSLARIPAAARRCAAYVAVLGLPAAATVSAQSYYYGETANSNVPAGAADLGAAVNLYTSVLSYGTCIGNMGHINHEFWYGLVPGISRWVEVGFKDGRSPVGCVSKALFWGENNGSGYYIHLTGMSWSLNTWYQLWIGQSSSNSCVWIPFINGTSLGSSMSNCGDPSGRDLQAGIEVYGSQLAGHAKGWQYNWQRADSGGTWHSDWATGFGSHSDSPPYCDFISPTEAEERQNESP